MVQEIIEPEPIEFESFEEPETETVVQEIIEPEPIEFESFEEPETETVVQEIIEPEPIEFESFEKPETETVVTQLEVKEIQEETEESYIESLINQADTYLADIIRSMKSSSKAEKNKIEQKDKEEKEDEESENKIEIELIEEPLQENKKISIKYTYNFNLTSAENGILTIQNNAGYPKNKTNF